ncbi:MAG: hypothetical protein APF81_12730 [Desulfosporosinus sp. BRH_c37]|nr:MAG: hypothetical protein APF81_12730 [Desulfosporosinus sp. BRH_c37]
MKQLLLQPVDTFFFRNHKNFTPGENATATTIFPPRPGTIYGALRSAYIHCKSDFSTFAQGSDQDLKEWMGTPRKAGQFTLRGCLMHINNHTLLPLPLDYQVVKTTNNNNPQNRSMDKPLVEPFQEIADEKAERAYPLILKNDNDPASDGREYRLYGVSVDKSSSSAGALVGLDQWKQEIVNRTGLTIYRSSRFIEDEDKLGITRDWETKTAREGMVYQIKMSRFKTSEDSGESIRKIPESSGFLAVCNKTPAFSSVPYLRLGGKNRPWTLHELKEDFNLFTSSEEKEIIGQIEKSGIARLILLSPAIWTEQSAYYLREEARFRVNQELEFPILTEAIGRLTLVGGWDIARNAPKPRMQAVPAGTVLYLQVAKEQARKLVMAVKDAVLSDELGYEGYGWAVCGAGKLEEKI